MARFFAEWIAKKMEDKLTECPSLGYSEIDKVRVAMCSLAFDNSKII